MKRKRKREREIVPFGSIFLYGPAQPSSQYECPLSTTYPAGRSWEVRGYTLDDELPPYHPTYLPTYLLSKKMFFDFA